MDLSEKYEKLLVFISKHEESSAYQRRGEPADVLVSRFQNETNIRFKDSYASFDAIRYLLKQGWIEMISTSGQNIGGNMYPHSRIILTYKGILHAEEIRCKDKSQ